MHKLAITRLLLFTILGLMSASAWADTTYTLNKSFPATLTAAGAGQYQCSALRPVLEDIESKTSTTLGKVQILFSDSGATTATYQIDLNNHSPADLNAAAYYMNKGKTVWGWEVTWARTGSAPVVIERADPLKWINLGNNGIVLTVKALHFRAANNTAGGYLLETGFRQTFADCIFDCETGVAGLAIGGAYQTWNGAHQPAFNHCVFRNISANIYQGPACELRFGMGQFNDCLWQNCLTAVSVGINGNKNFPAQWVFNRCTIRDAAQVTGGLPTGILLYAGIVTVNDSSFIDVPRALWHAFPDRALYPLGSLTLNRCTLLDNERPNILSSGPMVLLQSGGGTTAAPESRPYSTQTTFTLNHCTLVQDRLERAVQFQGAAYDAVNSSIKINACVIKHTSSPVSGSAKSDGVHLLRSGTVHVHNTLIKGFCRNIFAEASGPASEAKKSELRVVHCVLAASRGATTTDGTLQFARNTNATGTTTFQLLNSIIDADNAYAVTLTGSNASLIGKDIRNNLFLKSGSTDPGNPFWDSAITPQFVDAANDDYRLGAYSGAVGKGLPVAESGLSVDAEGDARPLPTGAAGTDLGLDETDESIVPPAAARHWSLY